MLLRRSLISLVFALTATVSAAGNMALVMVEESGCMWCARWNEEIADIYPKTTEGKAAPLRRIDMHAARPDDLTFTRALYYTPTFVLMVDGTEVSRIEGYPGEDFFWGLLEQMLVKAGAELAESG